MSALSTDIAPGVYGILNIDTNEFVQRGNNIGDPLRTGPPGPGAAPNLDAVIWTSEGSPWVVRVIGPGGVVNIGVPGRPDKFWVAVQQHVLLRKIEPGSTGNWRLVPANDVE